MKVGYKRYFFACIIVVPIILLTDIKTIFNIVVLDYLFSIIIITLMFIACFSIYDLLWGDLVLDPNIKSR